MTRRSVQFGLLFIFVLGFALRYWYCFLFPHFNSYQAADAYGFLKNAEALLDLSKYPSGFWSEVWQCLLGTASQTTLAHVKEMLTPLRDIPNSGLVMPTYLACCYLFSGSQFSIANWGPPVFVQCLVSALTGVFVALTGTCVFNKRTGLVAGILCALYPSFIVNTNRLYGETFAAFLVSVVCFLTVRSAIGSQSAAKNWVLSFANGLATAVLQNTRSIMFLLTLLVIPFTLSGRGMKRRLLSIAGFLLAFAIIAVPWLAFQKLLNSSSGLVQDRGWQYNYAVGTFVDTAGWLSYPYPEVGDIKHRSLPSLIKESIRRSPTRWLKLLQDKPLRLFKFPWNDFKQPLGFLSFQWQVLIHQALILAASIGIVLAFVISDEQKDEVRHRLYVSKLFLLSVIGISCVYLFFIALPRYNVTAMPLVLLFAAVAADRLMFLARARNGLGVSIGTVSTALLLYLVVRFSALPWLSPGSESVNVSLAIHIFLSAAAVSLLAFYVWRAITMLAEDRGPKGKLEYGAMTARVMLGCFAVLSLPLLVIPAEANGRAGEWRAKLDFGQSLSQELVLPGNFSPNRDGSQMYLLIDSDSVSELGSVQIKIDENVIDAPVVPSIALVDDFAHFQNLPHGFMRESEWIFSCLCTCAGISNSDLRQWFVVPVPNNLVEDKHAVRVTLTNKGHADVPAIYGAYDTPGTVMSVPGVSFYSWEKAFYGVENERGLCDTRFNTRISSQSSIPSTDDLSSEPGKQCGRYNIHLLAAPAGRSHELAGGLREPAEQAQKIFERHFDPTAIFDQARRTECSLKGLPAYSLGDWWVVRLKGLARRSAGNAQISLSAQTNFLAASDPSSGSTCLTRKWGEAGSARPNVSKPYLWPWTTHRSLSADWQVIDLAIPLVPGSFGAPVREILYRIEVVPQESASHQVAGRTELQNLTAEIIRLPAGPLTAGYSIY